jgi:hypothetical protein
MQLFGDFLQFMSSFLWIDKFFALHLRMECLWLNLFRKERNEEEEYCTDCMFVFHSAASLHFVFEGIHVVLKEYEFLLQETCIQLCNCWAVLHHRDIQLVTLFLCERCWEEEGGLWNYLDWSKGIYLSRVSYFTQRIKESSEFSFYHRFSLFLNSAQSGFKLRD